MQLTYLTSFDFGYSWTLIVKNSEIVFFKVLLTLHVCERCIFYVLCVGPAPSVGGAPVPSGVPLVPQRVWSEHHNPEGKVYYYNKVTRQSVWDKPMDYELVMPLPANLAGPSDSIATSTNNDDTTATTTTTIAIATEGIQVHVHIIYLYTLLF